MFKEKAWKIICSLYREGNQILKENAWKKHGKFVNFNILHFRGKKFDDVVDQGSILSPSRLL